MALWTPDRTTTALWLDAADTSTITESDGLVSAWADKSGNPVLYAEAMTTSERPSIVADAYNSNTALNFNGSSNRLMLSSYWLGLARNVASYTVFHVAELTNPDSFENSVLMLYNGVNDIQIRNRPGMSALGYRRLDSDAYSSASYGLPDPDGITLTTHVTDYLNGKAYVGRNGSFNEYLSLLSSGTTSDTDSVVITIGATGNSNTSQNFEGRICEIIALRYFPDIGLRQKIEGYLAHKWGLAASLPAEHPYKIAAPTYGFFHGTVIDKDGNPAERRITVLDATGHCVATDTSDPVTGAYSIDMPNDDPYTLVFDGEPDRNAQVFANVIPGEPPA